MTFTPDSAHFLDSVRRFREFGSPTVEAETLLPVPVLVNEFWTSKQRDAHSLHEISYRACFKPQLPAFFIERLTQSNDVVYDPFMGRGTTLLEAALQRRIPAGCDINPLSAILLEPRLNPPTMFAIEQRIASIELERAVDLPEKLLVFYHPQTLAQICALREYFREREETGRLDRVDKWIRMVATNRLTGHSSGFFSVYTLPPNQAISVPAQAKINSDRNQTPPERNVKTLILTKSYSLLRHTTEPERSRLEAMARQATLLTGDSRHTAAIPTGSVSLVVTSPPFLDVVNYTQDNWLRCWFNGIEPETVPMVMMNKLNEWQEYITELFRELKRVLRPGGYMAFEVGEIRHGKLRLEEAVIPCVTAANLVPIAVVINSQKFTKTANCWGINNNDKGTNSNRIVVAVNSL